jgi:hypothetical protein
MQEDGELNKLRESLSAPRHGQQELAAEWSSVEMQHLVPILTALMSGVVLSATCLLLEHGARRWAARRRSVIERKIAAGFGNQIPNKAQYYV